MAHLVESDTLTVEKLFSITKNKRVESPEYVSASVAGFFPASQSEELEKEPLGYEGLYDFLAQQDLQENQPKAACVSAQFNHSQ